jgi:hypothetical protein
MPNVQKCDQCNAKVAPYGMRVNSFCVTHEYKCACGYAWQDHSDIVGIPSKHNKNSKIEISPVSRTCDKCGTTSILNRKNWHLDNDNMPIMTHCRSCASTYKKALSNGTE